MGGSVILFGTGKYYEKKYRSLKKDYTVEFCIDNNVAPGTQKINGDGIVIKNPLDVKVFDKPIYLMSVHFIEMWKQLLEIGVNPKMIILPFYIEPFFAGDEEICNCVESIVFGKEYFTCYLKDDTTLQIHDDIEWRDALRSFFGSKYQIINAVSNMDVNPVSRQFGTERGTPVDRYYISDFLKNNRKYITGKVLEIEDAKYTHLYGTNYTSIVMDVSSSKPWVNFNANLETGEGIEDSVADCFILTQTLMYIYDLNRAAESIYRLLKPGGIVLITCSGISQNSVRCMDNYGCYFNFNASVFDKLFGDKSRYDVLESGSYGNVKTVAAHLIGLCQEDLDEADFRYNDPYYPLITYAVVRRK